MSAWLAVPGRAEVRPTVTAADEDEGAFLGLLAAETGQVVGEPGVGRRTLTRVARCSGRVVGFSRLSITAEAPTAVLDWLYVNHDLRRRGVGAALVHDARAEARRAGLSGVDVVAHPVAETFFRRVGAVRVGTVGATSDVPWARPRFFIAAAADDRVSARGLAACG